MEKLQQLIIKELVRNQPKTRNDLASFKRMVSKKYKTKCPNNIELLKTYHGLVKNKSIKRSKEIENFLKTRPVRSLSGIVNISVLTKPYPCPGKCIYCPMEKGIPKSYVSGEPAVERAKALKYNPYLQVKKRIETLEQEGHPTDKIELRIVGGTFSYYPKKYQKWFVKRCFKACNDFADFKKNRRTKTLEQEQKENEDSKHRIIGLSIETRPDFIDQKEVLFLRKLGVTMIEFGVQSIYDNVLKLNRRGHGIKATIDSTKLLKDAGFKVLYQMMPNLPGSDLKKDEKMFIELFSDHNFQPDLLKIYPCALLKETSLYNWYLDKKYKPYSEKSLISLIKKIKLKIPSYVRIQRIIRDIPSLKIVEGGSKVSNLRQIIAMNMKKENWFCQCIRCREVKEEYDPKEKLFLFRKDYNASSGKEIFLSIEDKNKKKLYSLLRLRIPSFNLQLSNNKTSQESFFPCLKNAALIREIHTYGKLKPLNSERPLISPQHKGLGKKLIKEAEKIIKEEFGLNKIAVISGVGVRPYFRKLGYRLKDTYMVKSLK